jgi:hypothetical protein
MIYNALCRYFNVLEKTGYMAIDNALKLLVLIFYRNFVYSDYRCTITKDDYRLIERALNCLYGTTCLIPYPDYLKMGKLHLSEVTELACRIKALEDEKVVKVIHDLNSVKEDIYSDVMVVMGDDEGNNGGSSTDPKDNEFPSNPDDHSTDNQGGDPGTSNEGRDNTTPSGGTSNGGTTDPSQPTVTPGGTIPGGNSGGHDWPLRT